MVIASGFLTILSPKGDVLLYKGEEARALRFIHGRRPAWPEVLEMIAALRSTAVPARLSQLRRRHPEEDPLETKTLRNGPKGQPIFGYRIRKGFTVVDPTSSSPSDELARLLSAEPKTRTAREHGRSFATRFSDHVRARLRDDPIESLMRLTPRLGPGDA